MGRSLVVSAIIALILAAILIAALSVAKVLPRGRSDPGVRSTITVQGWA